MQSLESCGRIDGNATKVIEALAFLQPSRSEAKEKVAALATYLKNNLDRMDYPAYRKSIARLPT